MIETRAAFTALAALLFAGVAGWTASVVKRDVSLVDSLWGPFFLLALASYVGTASAPIGDRGRLVAVLVAVWALRLAGHIAWRRTSRASAS